MKLLRSIPSAADALVEMMIAPRHVFCWLLGSVPPTWAGHGDDRGP